MGILTNRRCEKDREIEFYSETGTEKFKTALCKLVSSIKTYICLLNHK